MRKIFTLLMIFAVSSALAASKSKTKQVKVTQVKSEGATLYKGKNDAADAKAITQLNGGVQVTLIKKGDDRSYVKTNTGLKGFVDNSKIEILTLAEGASHDIGNQEILGWLDNPSAVYILDNSGPDLSALPLDRRFDDEILEPRDREEVERGNDEN